MADFNNYGFSQTMGPQLRHEVERQLLIDLKHYHNFESPLRFDWSESSIEGKDASYMDGSLEKYSGISVFNDKMELVADGWMDFILTDRFIVYWEFLDLYNEGTNPEGKDTPGIPPHVWHRLTADEHTRLKGKNFEYFL